jgi:hypothetical protein
MLLRQCCRRLHVSGGRSLYLSPPFVVEQYEPVVQKTLRDGKLEDKVHLNVNLSPSA